ncbi:MAG: hypothetical protein ABEL76_01925 [Bradymonadaceae bacterium]
MLEYPDSYLRIGAVALLLAGLYLVVGAVRLRFATIKYLYYGGTLGVAAVRM